MNACTSSPTYGYSSLRGSRINGQLWVLYPSGDATPFNELKVLTVPSFRADRPDMKTASVQNPEAAHTADTHAPATRPSIAARPAPEPASRASSSVSKVLSTQTLFIERELPRSSEYPFDRRNHPPTAIIRTSTVWPFQSNVIASSRSLERSRGRCVWS